MTGNRLAMTRRLAALILVAQNARRLPNIEQLAREHGVSERTIWRDLLAIETVIPLRWRSERAA